MEQFKLLSKTISEDEQHILMIEPIRITGRKTILGYRLVTRRIVSRGDYSMDYGYIGDFRSAYLPKKAIRIDWDTAKSLLGLNKDLFQQTIGGK